MGDAEELEVLNVREKLNGLLSGTDWRMNENANIDYSFGSLFFRLAGEVLSRYTLLEVYPKEISKAHMEGDLHLHNLYMGITGYCAGWSLLDLLKEGFNGVPRKVAAFPPKHLSSALQQLSNFIGTLQNEWAGAQAFNSFDTLLAPYVRKDGLDYKEVKQNVQMFIYDINVASRWGGQTPFTNITFDLRVPEDLKDLQAIWAGRMLDSTYADYQEEMEMINKAFMEIMTEGDMNGRIFTFPIPTYNITKDFDWDSEISRSLFEMTAKYGIPYFQNFVSSDLDPRAVRSMCCHLRLDLRELYHRVGGFFGYADKTGSVGVVTINVPRIGLLARDETDFLERLSHLMELAKESLEIKRSLVGKNIERGLLPFTKRYLGTLKWHFSTLGLVGMNEACLNFLGTSIASKEGKDFAMKVLKFMRDKTAEFQEETGHLYNLEATPAESTGYRLAGIDKERYPEIVAAGERVPYYTNSTHLPAGYTDDIFDALEHQEDFQVLYTGGTVFHAFVGERISSAENCKLLVRKMAESFRMPYFTITPTFSICGDHGYLAGEHSECPLCGKPVEVYSRVVGYFRPVRNWNEGKKEEFGQRLEYSEQKALNRAKGLVAWGSP